MKTWRAQMHDSWMKVPKQNYQADNSKWKLYEDQMSISKNQKEHWAETGEWPVGMADGML